MIIPFNIKHRAKIESGEYKVRTASGEPARIVCWDMKTQFNDPVLAVITDGETGREYACNYREDGLYVGNNENYLVIDDGRPNRSRWENKVLEIMENTVSIEKTAEALYDAAKREYYERMFEAVRSQVINTPLHDGVVIEGTNGQARDDGPELKAFYDR